jgi:hypothetical protein
MTVRSSSHGRRRFHYFICASYDHRGRTVCANGVPLPMDAADDAVLTKIRDYVLDPKIVEGALVDAINRLQPSREIVDAKRRVLTARLAEVDREQANCVAAIAVAGHVDALARALQEREQARVRLYGELSALDNVDRLSGFDVRCVERELRRRLTEWRQLLRRQTPLARQVLSRLLDGRIVWTPRKDDGLYTFAGRVKFDGLLSGIVFTRRDTSPTGFEPVFQP